MKNIFKSWKKTPTYVRKPVTFFFGMLVVLCSGLIGWLPGPGGIPLFLIGIAILASEFEWADRLKKLVLNIIYKFGAWFRLNRLLGSLFIGICCLISVSMVLMIFYRR